MGYGDIVPVTDVERIFTLGVALIGAVVFSYCMGTVATLISEVRARVQLAGIGPFGLMPANLLRKTGAARWHRRVPTQQSS